jgi:transcriptional regulator with XRE-family HTH domain
MAVPSKLDIAVRIRTARKKKGWSQEHLAQLAGTGRHSVIRWEMGKNLPGGLYRRILADLLDIDFSDLERDEDEEQLLSLLDKIAEIHARRQLGARA